MGRQMGEYHPILYRRGYSIFGAGSNHLMKHCGPRGDGRRVDLARKDLLELQRGEAVYGINN